MANEDSTLVEYPSRQHFCKDCGLLFESAKSLEVHFQYHKENLLNKWASQAPTAQNEQENNNNTKIKVTSAATAAADSSDNMITKPSPEFQQRATPETSAAFGHPATPQSYASAPSPYQNPDQTGFSPNAQFNSQFAQHTTYAQHDSQAWEQSHYAPEYTSHKLPRFHPYGPPERSSQVSSSSPVYNQPLNQPTPSPSPKQCDKCGFVCDSAAQLTEHCNNSHPPTPQGQFNHQQHFQQKQYGSFSVETHKIKEEQEETADILDLDSQKVVHQGGDENSVFEQGNQQLQHNGLNPHPVSAMLPWSDQKLYSPHSHINGDPKLFSPDHKMFPDHKHFSHDHKMFSHDQKAYPDPKVFPQDSKIFSSNLSDPNLLKAFIHQDQKIYQPHQLQSIADYQSNAPTSSQEMQPPYRPYDSPVAPQISSTQASNPSSTAGPPMTGKGANWKSNEARRPKTYNCTACNKWFTSSGHLKRHYNTTLHKNAVRSSGHPDPATLPISTHHHPARDPHTSNRGQQPNMNDSNTQSPLPSDDVRSPDDGSAQSSYSGQSFERNQHPGISPSVKAAFIHHQQNNVGNTHLLGNNPLANHPLPHQVGTHPLNIGNPPPGLENSLDGSQSKTSSNSSLIIPSGSPPNGQAGPSVHLNHPLRGLLSVSTNNTTAQVIQQATPPLMAHNLPPFSHLSASPYSPRHSDHMVHTPQDPTHTAIYLGQNFQQTLGQNYPNAMAPHVMDMASNSLPITNLATIGEMASEHPVIFDTETILPPDGPLPSFAQFQTHRYGIVMPNYSPMPNVGGYMTGEASPTPSYFVITTESFPPPQVYSPEEGSADSSDLQERYSLTELQDFKSSPKQDSYEDIEYGKHALFIKEEVMDESQISNKENYESQVESPNSPQSLKIDYESNGSPSISSTVSGPPLTANNKQANKSGDMIHKCYECDKFFNKACYLTQHNKSFHSGAKPFKCARCGKRFANEALHQQHCSKHAGDKPFKCHLCPKQFNHKTDLRRHMCLHSGEKPFSCYKCGKGFIRKDHMLKHCETHRKKPSTKINSRNSIPTM